MSISTISTSTEAEPLPAAPPTLLSDAEHMLNLCTLGMGLLVQGRVPESLGDDTIVAYQKIISSYLEWTDAGRPLLQK